jgi:hypothetical protein
MTIIRIPIVRWVRDDNPGWVECLLTDASGRTWRLVDKLAIFSKAIDLDENSVYPQPGILACEAVAAKVDAQNRNIVVINIEKPWGVESVEGATLFDVFQAQIKTI